MEGVKIFGPQTGTKISCTMQGKKAELPWCVISTSPAVLRTLCAVVMMGLLQQARKKGSSLKT